MKNDDDGPVSISLRTAQPGDGPSSRTIRMVRRPVGRSVVLIETAPEPYNGPGHPYIPTF